MMRDTTRDITGLIDTHAHLSMLSGRGISPEKRLEELFSGGFGGIIDVGTEAHDLAGRIDAFSRFDRIRFAGGIWPHPAAIAGRRELTAVLEQQLQKAPPALLAAVGECGLDRHWNQAEAGADIAGEGELLEAQLDLAKQYRLPIIIHSRDAAAETLEILSRRPDVRGVIHCFSYGVPQAKAFLDRGYYLSFAGNLTYKNAGPLREALRFVPPDRLLLETDSPYLAPVPFRGSPAEPGMVGETCRLAAELRGISREELTALTAQNAVDLFGLDYRSTPPAAIR
ncbi:MAG: TatD family hydrolase [Spirochaetaceae bacterium]|jgi:TatD DNase family protein|nr:TatD family hydrolase [Spirochaetaceae bacterium]